MKIMKLNETQFLNNYYYASELKKLAKDMGIQNIMKLRKDELEKIILKYIKTGKINNLTKNQLTHKNKIEDTLNLNSYIKNYKNNKKTWIFINCEVRKLEPNFKEKSGAKYWLNRWRENQIKKGNQITYRDLVKEYLRLTNISKLPQIPSAKFNNFITDFLKNEKGKTRANAIKEWERLKKMNLPKNYISWKKGNNPLTTSCLKHLFKQPTT